MDTPAVDMTKGSVSRHILKLFFPVLLASLLQQLYGLIDAVIVGHFLGKEALAAVGGSSILLINFVLYIIIGVANGVTVVAAQAYGAGSQERYYLTESASVKLCIVTGVCLTAVGVGLSGSFLKWMNTPEDVLALSRTYLKLYSLSFIPACIYNICAGLLRVKGDNWTPFLYLLASSVINTILVFLFVWKLEAGVAGTACATVLSQYFSAVCVAARWKKGRTKLKKENDSAWKQKKKKEEGRLVLSILKIGIPTALQSDLYLIANMIMQIQINGYGTDTVAAFSAYGRVDSFFWVIMSAFGIAVMTFAGSNYGAGQYKRIKKGIRITTVMAGVSAAAFSLFTVTMAPWLMSLFGGDEEVARIGISIYRIVTPFYVSYVITEIFAGGIRGCGKTLVPMILTGVGVCLIRIIWTAGTAVLGQGMDVLMISYPVTWILTSLGFAVYYVRGKWLINKNW